MPAHTCHDACTQVPHRQVPLRLRLCQGKAHVLTQRMCQCAAPDTCTRLHAGASPLNAPEVVLAPGKVLLLTPTQTVQHMMRASPPSPPDIAPVPGKNAAADAVTQSPAAAAVQMGPATTLGAQGPAAKADNSGNSSKALGAKRGKAKAGTQADGGEDGKEQIAKDGEEWVSSWTGKVYPRSVCYRPGDKLIQELTMDDLVGDYEVERIVDEFVTNKSKWYLIKYKGYELRLGNGENDKGDWELQKNVKGTEAFRQWQRSKPAYFFQLVGDQAKPSK
ncbi:hypothetical protein DUNSADRAFT_15444 [Dunaliella salina]|uniref:Chromo domain-containing protein n=1 Tax=Dunaliella salina TaxID=3046 RepID=A0ABQ7G5J0_DUNSA|nr:hypothetical protein DUNSADRAFT_15444 [Dunaliella salina]|eukprot:KAF5829826.1 hypothetical protein DUNSADRAFT_15444 [Dunaliella salina]